MKKKVLLINAHMTEYVKKKSLCVITLVFKLIFLFYPGDTLMSAEYRLTVVRKEITDSSMSTELKTKPMQGKPFLVLLFNSAILFLRQQE